LRNGAADSLRAVIALNRHTEGRAGGGQPSHAGVCAVNSAVSSIRGLQASRVSKQASDMSVGGSRYADTDADSAGRFTESI
jgi:hypothetical protein